MSDSVIEKWSMTSPPALTDDEFLQWRELLEHRVGMQIPEQRRGFLQTSLSIRMREIGCADYSSYYDYVLDGKTGLAEWGTLVDRLTVQETRFFRDLSACDLVNGFFREKLEQDRQINIWSVGCSTGEEPYTLAILANEIFGDSDMLHWSVTASDISQPALNKARQGLYPRRKLETVETEIREKYFTAEGDHYRVTDRIRERVCFVRMNVLDLGKSPLGDFDLIYCQNLLIYFRRWRRKEIAGYLAQHLAPGGILVFGAGEVMDWRSSEISRISGVSSLAFVKNKA